MLHPREAKEGTVALGSARRGQAQAGPRARSRLEVTEPLVRPGSVPLFDLSWMSIPAI